MKIKILETNKRLGVVAGEVYQAKRYHMDPTEKYELLGREPDGHDPECSQYINEVATWIQKQWMVVDDSGRYVPHLES